MSKAAPESLERLFRRATKPSTASSARVTTNKIKAATLAYDPARKSAIETRARKTLIKVIRFGDIIKTSKNCLHDNRFSIVVPGTSICEKALVTLHLVVNMAPNLMG